LKPSQSFLTQNPYCDKRLAAPVNPREIGERCGYDTEIYLKVLFKKRFGVTMRAYRKK